MLEHSVYTVATPEACAAILWKDVQKSEQAASALKITALDLKELGIIDEIVPEPPKVAHGDPLGAASILKTHLLQNLDCLSQITPNERKDQRYQKFRQMGIFQEITVPA
jgi:acetyl-CoA carboxylase carboxyl transferase subunit alpha